MKAASLVGYFGAGSGWLKVAAEKAEAERMRKALVCLKAAALVKEPYSPVLLASMPFHCRTFAGPKPQRRIGGLRESDLYFQAKTFTQPSTLKLEVHCSRLSIRSRTVRLKKREKRLAVRTSTPNA